MCAHLLQANPAVADDTGRVALQRGPVVFCMEQLDQRDSQTNQFSLLAATLNGHTEGQFDPTLLDGIVMLTHKGMVNQAEASSSLYEPVATTASSRRETSLRLIPYYAWANREQTAMQVWIPYERT